MSDSQEKFKSSTFQVGDSIVNKGTDVEYIVSRVMENGGISLVGCRGIYHASAFELTNNIKLPLYTEPELAEIEALQDRVEYLESLCSDYAKIVEEKDVEIEKLKHQVDKGFKPISEMTITDWKKALEDRWEFLDNDKDVCEVESVNEETGEVGFDLYLGHFDVKGKYIGTEPFMIVSRSK